MAISNTTRTTRTTQYADFIAAKTLAVPPSGFDVSLHDMLPQLYDWQRLITRWALRRGRAALFEDCGLGKTPQQLEWGRHVATYTGMPVLGLAPLAVTRQTQRIGASFGIPVTVCRSQDDVRDGINFTNYEMLEHFDASAFGGVILDESSILKAYDGRTRTQIIESFQRTPYRLACTATPSPNDYMELGNHAEFLGVMTRTEMLATFFVHDGGDTSKWRLKGHAETEFYKWVASWAVMLRKPSDIGFADEGFALPELVLHQHVVEGIAQQGQLLPVEALSLMERRQARKASIGARVETAAQLVNDNPATWLVWCDLNDESHALAQEIDGAVEVVGADKNEDKERKLMAFSDGDARVMVTKPSIAGWGMNWQHCNHMAFVGLSDSYEQFYQAIRRCWRFGQTQPVHVHVITSENDGAVVANIKRKEEQANMLYEGMVSHCADFVRENIMDGLTRDEVEYREEVATGNGWEVRLGDSIDMLATMPSDTVDYSIFSPPFEGLYVYSNSSRDIGNCRDSEEFFQHFGQFMIPELFRVLKPGRLLSFHCMNLPTSKANNGFIGIRDFRGQLIRAFQDAGFIFHSEVCIWKDPVTAMQRTKALGLLHKQLKKDSCMSRQGIPDYLVTVRKPGTNPDPVTHTNESFPVSLWQRYASPVWMDINPSDTLQRESARDEKDERHICPLQLEVIRRALALWTNDGDLVYSPFAGIGSEGVVSVEMGRRFLGGELKESYWRQAVANLRRAEEMMAMPRLDL